MKKILFLNCSCVGSTGKIIRDVALSMDRERYEPILCVPKAEKLSYPIKVYALCCGKEQSVYRRIAYLFSDEFGFAPFSTQKLIRVFKKEKPDVVHIHCANGHMVNIYRVLNFLKKNRVPTVLTNHAEFYYTGNCAHAVDCPNWQTGCGNCPRPFGFRDRTSAHWARMKASLEGFERLVVTSVSPWVYQRAIRSPIMANIQHDIIENGLDTSVFHMRDTTKATLLSPSVDPRKYQKIIFHATAYFSPEDKTKGGFYVVKLAEIFHDVLFLVACNTKGKCENLPDNLIVLGRVSDQNDLARYYSLANLTLITSIRETFSMPVAESLCCGTPIVGFKAGGPESIAMAEYSEFMEFGDIQALSGSIQNKWLYFKTKQNAPMIAAAAQQRYNKNRMAEKYLAVYEKLLEK